ncbi:endocuticle structural glycoprotein SgAbd-8-like [Aphis gossypii]|nr:endocuticle structural glycoprotein SgAbd-8-like [Aphis gossypii]
MKLTIAVVSCMLVSLASCQQYQPTTPIPIVRYENDGVNFDGSYKWAYETGNGIQAQESGYVQPAQDPSQSALNVEGGYSYTAPDGTPISVKYVAGPQGFVPVGDHLPTPPPLPPAIAKLLQFLATQPSTPEPAYNKIK